MDSRKLWQAVMGELELSVSPASFKTWFRGTDIISQEDGHIIVAVPNIFTKEWFEKKYNSNIKETLGRFGVSVKSIEYKVSTPKAAKETRDPMVSAVSAVAPAHKNPRVALGTSARPNSRTQENNPTQLNPRYTFENFVVGGSNDLAYAASQAVAKYPGEKYNLLFLYGGVGLGKTHLMQAIGNEILANDPEKRVRYVTSEQFTSEFLNSIQTKKTKTFADLYRNLDVLIVDDIQFLGNKERTQEEFFHTFNTLHHANKQIIMSSDKRPRDIPHLEDRLRSRFEMGMSADIQRPDLETRAAIIQRKAMIVGKPLPLEVIEFLARNFNHSIRELEGVLSRLLAVCEMRGEDVSMAMVKALVGDVTPPRRKTITPKAIIEKTASYFDIQPADITGSKRDKEIVVPRQIAMYLMREELGLSYPKIATHVGGRDHTTAMHSVAKIEKLIEQDDDLRAEINGVKERITV